MPVSSLQNESSFTVIYLPTFTYIAAQLDRFEMGIVFSVKSGFFERMFRLTKIFVSDFREAFHVVYFFDS